MKRFFCSVAVLLLLTSLVASAAGAPLPRKEPPASTEGRQPAAAVASVQFRGVVLQREFVAIPHFVVQAQEVISGPVHVGQQVDVYASFGSCGTTPCSSIQVGQRVEVSGSCLYAGGEECGRVELYEMGYIRPIAGPACPDPPYLYSIDNPDCDGSYLVHWQPPSGSIAGTTVYVLQEDDNDDFAHPTEVYRNIPRLFQVVDHVAGIYFYRVKAVNPDCESGWSSVRSVTICGLAPPVLYPINNPDCDGAYSVSWSTVSAATYYELEEDDNASFSSPSAVYSGSAISTDISGKSPGIYYYRVKACDASRCSNWSNVESVRVWPLPDAPTLDPIDNPDCGTDYTVSWSTAVDATSYELQEDVDPDFSEPTTIYRGAGTSKDIVGQGLGTFHYRVRAVNCRDNSPWSNIESTYVLPPPDLYDIENPDCDGDYSVSWSEVADATGYELQKDDDPSFPSPTLVYQGPLGEKHFQGKAPATYYYRVRAIAATCKSDWSNTRSVKVWRIPDAALLDPIENQNPCDGEYTVSWSEVEDATRYILHEDEHPSFASPTVIYQGPDTSMHVRSQSGGTHYYRVKAENCRASSDWSNSQSVYVLAAPDLDPIANPDCDGDYVVSWSLVPDAATYEVQEDDDPSFPSPEMIFQGAPFLSWRRAYVSGRSAGVYYYRARAANARCHSAWSNVEPIRVWRIPDAPSLNPLDPHDPLDGSYTISWSSVTDASEYQLLEDYAPVMSGATAVYTGPATSVLFSCHAGGDWYYRVRASNCRADGAWSNVLAIELPEAPSVTGVEATLDGVDGDEIGSFMSLPGAGIPVWNTFTADVQAVAGTGIDRVEFTIAGETQTDRTPGDGWTARFDMTELPPGNVTLRVIAYAEDGLCSPPAEITVYTAAPPPWYGQPWVADSHASWSAAQNAWTFTGRVPNNPSLYHREDYTLPYLGTLRNWFESDIVVTEKFRIDGEWEYQARGKLRAELMNITAVDREYPAQPILARPPRKPEYGLEYYEWWAGMTVPGVQVPVVRDIPIVTFSIGPVSFTLELSIDVGVEGSINIRGCLLPDLTVGEIRLTPGISPYAVIDIGLEILWGVAKVGIRGKPNIAFYLPIVYESTPPAGKSKLYLDDPCVRFRFIVRGYAKFVFWEKESDPWTVFDQDHPSGCSAGLQATMSAIEAEVDEIEFFAAPAIAADGSGRALAVWIADRDPSPDVVEGEVFYALWDGQAWSTPAQLTHNERAETDPQVAFLSSGEALAAWTQNELSRAEVEPLEDVNAVLAKQELYYSHWDGSQWSEPARITHNDAPDGMAALAAGPDGGALVLWVRDSDADVQTRDDWRIDFSEWNGSSWSAPAPITMDPGGSVAQPAVAYDGTGRALAVCTHDADSDLLTPEDRYLAYASWDGVRWSALSVRDDWPAGALAPVVAFDQSDQPLLVFTVREQDAEGQFHGEGLHDLLWSAHKVDGDWQLAAIGASTKAAEPQLAINPSNYAVVAFRGFRGQDAEGFGGDVVLAVANLNEAPLEWSTPQFLTQDAARDWEIGTTIDPVSGRTLILDMHQALEGAGVSALALHGPGTAQALGAELASLDIPFGKDLSIAGTDIAFSHAHPQPGEMVRITATVRNLGLESVGAAERPRVRIERLTATTQLIGEVTLDQALLHNGTFEATASWHAVGGLSDIRVTVDSTQRVEELNEANNLALRTIGRPPVPRYLLATPHPEGEAILLDWDDADTAGRTVYHVYRSTFPGGGYEEVGESAESRYVDLGLEPGTKYYYVVTAEDSFAAESEYSNEASAMASFPVAAILRLPIILRQ